MRDSRLEGFQSERSCGCRCSLRLDQRVLRGQGLLCCAQNFIQRCRCGINQGLRTCQQLAGRRGFFFQPPDTTAQHPGGQAIQGNGQSGRQGRRMIGLHRRRQINSLRLQR